MSIDPARLFRGKLLFWIAAGAGLALDLGSKAWATAAIKPESWALGAATPRVPFIDGVLAWKWAANLGAAFSVFRGRVWLLAVLAAAALAFIIGIVYRTEPRARTFLVAMGFVAAGAVGNLYDRIRFGWVRDFIYFDFDLPLHESVGFIPRRWPVYNVADVAIVAGVILLLLLPHKNAPETSSDAAGGA